MAGAVQQKMIALLILTKSRRMSNHYNLIFKDIQSHWEMHFVQTCQEFLLYTKSHDLIYYSSPKAPICGKYYSTSQAGEPLTINWFWHLKRANKPAYAENGRQIFLLFGKKRLLKRQHNSRQSDSCQMIYTDGLMWQKTLKPSSDIRTVVIPNVTSFPIFPVRDKLGRARQSAYLQIVTDFLAASPSSPISRTLQQITLTRIYFSSWNINRRGVRGC